MNSKQSILNPLIIILVGVLVAYGIFILSVQDSTTNLLNAGFHIFLAFLSGICVAVVWVRNSLPHSSKHLRMDVPLSFAVLVHARGFVVNLFSIVPIEDTTIPYYATFKVLEVFLLSFLFLFAVLDYSRDQNGTSLLNSKPVVLSLVIIAYLVYGVGTILLLSIAPVNLLFFFATPLFLITLCVGIISYVKLNKTQSTARVWDLKGINAGVILACLSPIPSLFSVLEASPIWFYTSTLQVVAIYILAISIFLPFLREIGASTKSAFIITQTLLMIILIPFIITLIAGAWSTTYQVVSPEAYTIIHGGAAFLSGLMALMIYSSRKEKIDWSNALLVIVFLSWCVIEVNLAVAAVINYSIGGAESLIPYLVGSEISTIIIARLLTWSFKPDRTRLVKNPTLIFSLSIVCTVMLVLASGLLQTFLLNYSVLQNGNPLGKIFQLFFNLVLMIEFTGLFLLLANKNKGKMTAELLALGFLALWIVPSILKGLFLDWTIGWWAAEIILLSGLLAGPSLIGFQYVTAVKEVKTAYERATLYADILMHDISNLHQGIRLSIEILDNSDMSHEFRTTLTHDALNGLDRASELIWSVRLLTKLEHPDDVKFRICDLLDAVRTGISEAERSTQYCGVILEVENPLQNHIIYADEYLSKIFMHLVRNAIQYSHGTPDVLVKVKPVINENNLFFQVFVIDSGCGTNDETREQLLHRFSTSAYGTGLGLSVVDGLTKLYGGTIEIQNRIPTDYKKGSIFLITLPSVLSNKHNLLKIRIQSSIEKEAYHE